jgi:hypothetical protein
VIRQVGQGSRRPRLRLGGRQALDNWILATFKDRRRSDLLNNSQDGRVVMRLLHAYTLARALRPRLAGGIGQDRGAIKQLSGGRR